MSEDVKNLLLVGVVGTIAYFLYQSFQGAKSVAATVVGAPAAAGTAISSSLFNFLNPNAAGESTFYTAQLPDGTYGSIPASSVGANNAVTYQGTQYQLVTDPSMTTGVNKFLVPLNGLLGSYVHRGRRYVRRLRA